MRSDIVVIDDDPSMRLLLQELLHLQGFVVQAFGSGAEAIAGADWDRVETLVVDWMMPDMSGVEVAAWTAETHPMVRRLIVTAAPEALHATHPEVTDLANVIAKTELPQAMFTALAAAG